MFYQHLLVKHPWLSTHPSWLCASVSTFFTFCRQKNFTLLVPCWQKQGWARFHENTCPPFFPAVKRRREKVWQNSGTSGPGRILSQYQFPPRPPPSILVSNGWWSYNNLLLICWSHAFWKVFKYFQAGSGAGLRCTFCSFFHFPWISLVSWVWLFSVIHQPLLIQVSANRRYEGANSQIGEKNTKKPLNDGKKLHNWTCTWPSAVDCFVFEYLRICL